MIINPSFNTTACVIAVSFADAAAPAGDIIFSESFGTLVTIVSITESTEDGGENIVTFSDGHTVTIRNGEKGAAGKDGEDYIITAADKQEIKDDVISSIVTQTAGQSESLVMSQKAVTDLVADALDSAGGGEAIEYETVDSIEEMTDTSKAYVLSTTGTLWAYGETTVEVAPANKFVASTATINLRLASSSVATWKGAYSTGYISFDGSTAKSSIVWLPLDFDTNFENHRLWLCAEDKSLIATAYIQADMPYRGYIVTVYDSDMQRYYIDMSMRADGITTIDLSSVKYVRLCFLKNDTKTAITTADIADVEILFENDRTTTTTMAWYDTRLTPSASGNGNYINLLVKVNENTSAINEVSNRVTRLEVANDTLTIPSFWKDAVDACIAKIKALQVGRNCLTFPFFSDNHQRNGYAGMLIAHIMKECHIPYCFYGGDSIDSGYIASEAVMIAQDKAFDTAMSYIPNGRFCRAVGNHDGYWAVDANNKNYYTDAQIYELFLREESIAQNKHFGGDGTYYYIDDIASKVRWIVMDTNDGTVEVEQINWLQNTALSFSESGWAVVFISHQPISNHYHALISNAEEVRTIIANYINGTATNKADVVGWYSGHVHRDRIWTGAAVNTTDDSEGDAMGFTQVTITSDHTAIAYEDATKHSIAADDQSHAIDFVTINRSTRTVNLTRLGIGSDRSYTY